MSNVRDPIPALLKTVRARFTGSPAQADEIEAARAALVSLALGAARTDPRVAEYRHPDNVRSYGDRADPLVTAALS